jgi:Arc/MetJ-type ribon-helix-helix transcriptional regulator
MTRRKLYTFAIDADIAAALKRRKAETFVSESEEVRQALRAWLESKGALKPTRAPRRKRRRQS